MLTLSLQWAVAVLMLGFGLAGLAIARRGAHLPPQPAGWEMAGTAYALAGADMLLQSAWGSVAFAAGPGSPAWNGYLPWAPVFNHSRTGLLMAFFVLLLAAAAWNRRRPLAPALPRAAWWGVLLLGGVAGAGAGWREDWAGPGHFRNVAISDATEMVLALTTLFVLLLRESVDRHLWMALNLYAAKLALNALWISAWIEASMLPRDVSPVPMHMARVVLGSAMMGLALRRLALARRGVTVPGLLSSLPRRGRGDRRVPETPPMF